MPLMKCPACEDGEKDVRIMGRYEPDTNAGGEMDIDPRFSCDCELTDEQQEELFLRAQEPDDDD